MWKQLSAAILLSAFVGPAAAGSCPTLMQEIDDLLAEEAVREGLEDRQLERVRELRERGEALHESGTHDESVDLLREALRILEVDPDTGGSGGYSY